tara:strand:- start:213614 stop:214066 length:453 start_codon:yes stop_codon:yes gene_type:complete
MVQGEHYLTKLSAQQIKRQSVRVLINWYRESSAEDIREFIRNGQLNRSSIASELGFSRSSYGSNKRLKQALDAIDGRLRVDGVLLSRVEPSETPVRDREASRNRIDKQRLKSLEAQNADLRVRLEAATEKLKQYKIFGELLAETGRVPRP